MLINFNIDNINFNIILLNITHTYTQFLILYISYFLRKLYSFLSDFRNLLEI